LILRPSDVSGNDGDLLVQWHSPAAAAQQATQKEISMVTMGLPVLAIGAIVVVAIIVIVSMSSGKKK
jgi:hypothetical protein